MQINVIFKKLYDSAVAPFYSHTGDAGLELTAVSKSTCTATETGCSELYYIEYGVGVSVEIPDGHVGMLFPRSSISKYDLVLCNSVGIIDSGYRGEIKVRFKIINKDPNKKEYKVYNVGDRIAQLIILPYPVVNLIESDRLSETARASGGFGSTGI
jgi:dUTP pyrophosphatase